MIRASFGGGIDRRPKETGSICLAGGGASRSVPTQGEFLSASRCGALHGTKKPGLSAHIGQHEGLPALPGFLKNLPRRATCNHDQVTPMSNATQPSRESGDSRRRRSRGGKNRNKQQQGGHRGGERGSREGRERSEEFRPQGQRPPRGRQPVKLSWWQKLLKAIGLYKEPVRPPRPERKPDTPTQGEPRPPKSNVRNARSGEGEGDRPERSQKRERGDRGERGERGERGNRSGERSRGGDGSTVESSRVYVGNLSYDVSEQDLQELFKGIGGVRNVEIVYNRSTHRSKGYGFVEMLHKDEAVRAVEVLHDQPFMGRKLNVSGAKSKGQDEREDNEERGESRTVSLAPLPAAAPQAAAPETAAPPAEPMASVDEPVIQTIIETVEETPSKNDVA